MLNKNEGITFSLFVVQGLLFDKGTGNSPESSPGFTDGRRRKPARAKPAPLVDNMVIPLKVSLSTFCILQESPTRKKTEWVKQITMLILPFLIDCSFIFYLKHFKALTYIKIHTELLTELKCCRF
uniref:Uncharacterized protein n=1 Tax=Oryzias latipes TaxID=8090 RepID=A0A3P9K9D2_ORYLA